MGLFSKKYCSICGEKIGLLGNRKLEDGNLCKDCASKLSPWFDERRHSTVEEIQEQLAYREANKEAVAAFRTTRVLGENFRVYLDEDAKKFLVTSAKNLQEANPDVLDYSQVTGCRLNVVEDRDEQMRQNSQGESVSYNPPRYTYSYDFYVEIQVNHPYFNVMSFRINRRSVQIDSTEARGQYGRVGGIDPTRNVDYQEYQRMGNEIVSALASARQEVRDAAVAAATPKQAVTCPYCGATTTPDANGRCEYCGGAIGA